MTSRARTLLDLAATTSHRDLERALEQARLQRLVTDADLERRATPPPTNVRVAGHEVDALWPCHRLVVEVDGFAFHSSRAAFERDRARGADLQAHGYRVMRVTWRRRTSRPETPAARLGAALAAAA